MIKSLIPVIVGVFMLANLGGFVFGSLDSTVKPGCTYKSIGARMNLGYILSCQLFKDRYE